MRIPTRVALGSSLLIALIAAVTAYEARTIAHLAAMQRELGERTLPSTALALDLVAIRDRLDVSLRKFAATGDPAYAAKAAEAAHAFDRDLARLRALRSVDDHDPDAAGLDRAWRSFPLAAAADADLVALLVAGDRQQLLATVSGPLGRLRAHLLAVVAADRQRAAERVQAAAAAATHARNLAVAALVVSVALAVAVTLVTVRSIRAPLDRLATAIAAIAAGRFDHRVAAAGDDELGRLAQLFNQMSERLAELDRLKSDLLSNVSHEIKTPLAAMTETTKLLLDEVAGPLTAKQRRLLELERDNQERLQTMISTVLDLARHDAGVVEYALADHPIRPILDEVRAQFEALASSRGVTLEVAVADSAPAVHCDRDRILQVFQNLVSNAIKVSPRQGTVTLAAGASDSGRPAVRCEVRDQGPGVADDDKPHLFDRFQRLAGQPIRARAGIGLGLAICREIVEAHGGRIWAEDAPGGGAVFVVELAAGSPRDATLA
jgi:two-component system sensor histidine kinase GlrK